MSGTDDADDVLADTNAKRGDHMAREAQPGAF
jgi:hypothetical protein